MGRGRVWPPVMISYRPSCQHRHILTYMTTFLSERMWMYFKWMYSLKNELAIAKRVSLSQLCLHTKRSSLLNNFIPYLWNCGCLTHPVHENKGLNIYLYHHFLSTSCRLGIIGVCIPFTCYPGPHLLRPYALVWDPSLGSVSAQVITAPLASVFQWAQLQFQFCHMCSVANQSQVQVREDTPHF